jgi:ribosomal protein S18 acetylase RimI-like enzyme
MEYSVSNAGRVSVVTSLTDDELRQIFAMERELFPEFLQDDTYDKELKGKVAVVAYCPEGRFAGYIFSVPHHEAQAELRHIDPRMPTEPDALYIESIAIRSDLQSRGYFSKLIKKLLERSNGRPITMHARVCNNCSVGMQKYGAIHVHSVEDWFGSGERFDYLVIRTAK